MIFNEIILLLFGYCYCINQKVFISLTHQTERKRFVELRAWDLNGYVHKRRVLRIFFLIFEVFAPLSKFLKKWQIIG